MNDNFVNCHICGTRNFNDDKNCGVCNMKLQERIESPKKVNYFILILIAVGLIFVYYSVLHKDKSPETQTKSSFANSQYLPEYSVLKTTLNNKKVFNIVICIQNKISEKKLALLAQQIKDKSTVADKGVILFNLPEMRAGNGAWASVNFDPDINVRIIGQSLLSDEEIRKGVDNINDYIGLWVDNFIPDAVIIRIRKDSKRGYVFEFISPTNPKPSEDEFLSPLKKVIKEGRTMFYDTESDVGEYFLIEENGNLSCYDNSGYVVTYQKLK